MNFDQKSLFEVLKMTHSDGLGILNFCSISEKYYHASNRLSHGTNSTCAIKSWHWRVQRWVKLSNLTLLGRYGVIWSRHAAPECRFSAIRFEMKISIWTKFQKKTVTRIFICRTTLIRRALQNRAPGASNSGSNFQNPTLLNRYSVIWSCHTAPECRLVTLE